MNFLRLAAEIATHVDDCRSYKIGAVAIRRDGTIVASANIPAQHQMLGCHAEARVLRKAGKNATLYVVRVMPSGLYGLARPCGGCLGLIRAKKVSKVFYTLGVDNLIGSVTF